MVFIQTVYFKYEQTVCVCVCVVVAATPAIKMKPYIFRLFKRFNSYAVIVKSVRSLKMFDFYP